MTQSVDAANAAFEELVRADKANPHERVTFQFGFAAGIRYAEYLLTKRTGRPAPTPAQLVSSEPLRLEKQHG